MRRNPPIALALATVLGAAVPAWSDTSPEAAALLKLFDPSRTEYASLFSPQFLAQVPEPKLKEIVELYVANLGVFQSSVGAAGDYRMLFSKGEAPAKVTLDAAGKMAGLWFGNWILYDDTPETLRSAFAALDGSVSVCVTRNGSQTVFALSPDTPLGVGSAFKLYVLKALTERIARGESKWADVLALRPEWMSLPTGSLQTWPAGTPLTLASLAALMISVSDNTATDHLLFFLGRSAVEAVSPARVRPFLSTAELFRIKWALPDKERLAYANASAADRARILAGLGRSDLATIVPNPNPQFIDTIEWPITTRELCGVIYELRESPYLSINPGLASKNTWSLAAFKGGSEPGVLNLTHVIRKGATDPVYAISATINNPKTEVDTQGFSVVVARLIGLVGRGGLQ